MQKIRSHLPLIALVLFAFVLRLWNIDFGLPYLYHPDEPRYINVALHIFQTGNIDPNSINELSINAFVYSSNAVAYVFYYWVGYGLGVFDSPLAIAPLEMVTWASGRAPLPTLVLYSRLITALFGTAAVFMLYWAARAFGCDRVFSLLAALLLAVSPGNVIHSKFVVADEMVVFFVCVTLWVAIQIVQRGWIVDYLVAGATLGFSVSAKLPGAIVLLPFGLAHLWRYGWRSLQQPKLYLAVFVALVAFVITTPFVLVDPLKVYADWQVERSHYALGHAGMEGDTLAWYGDYLWRIEGPLCALGVIGLLLGFYRRPKLTSVLASLPIIYTAIVGAMLVRNDRTILPILPALALFAAYAVGELWLLGSNRVDRSFRIVAQATMIAIACLIIAWPLNQTIEKNIRLGAVDGRVLAQAWLPDHLPQGAKVAVESYSPFVDPKQYEVQGFYQIIEHTPEWYVEEGFDYLIFSQGMFGRFFREPQQYADEIAQYQRFFDRFELIEQFEDFGYSISFVDSGYEIRIYKVETP